MGGQKAAILAQVGQIYFGAVGQFYIGANTFSWRWSLMDQQCAMTRMFRGAESFADSMLSEAFLMASRRKARCRECCIPADLRNDGLMINTNDIETRISSMTPAGMIRDIRAGEWFGLLSHGVAYSDTGANKDTSQWMVSMLHQPAPDGELRWLRSGDLVDVLRGTSGRFLLEVGSVFRGSSQVFVHLRRPDSQAPRAYQLGPGDYFWLNRNTITAAVSRIGPLTVTARVSEGDLCGPALSADRQDALDAIWGAVRSPIDGWNLEL